MPPVTEFLTPEVISSWADFIGASKNVTEWENELYSTIYRNHAERMKLELKELGVEMMPGLFVVVSNY